MGLKYMIRVGLQLPKPLLDKFDRIVLRDGTRRAALIRHLIWVFVQEEERRKLLLKNNDTAGGAAGGAALGTTR